MSRLTDRYAQQKAYDEQQAKIAQDKKNKSDPNFDSRNLASKIFDTLNPADSGRSWTTAKPSKDAAKQSALDQLKSDAKQTGDSIAAPFKRLGAGTGEVIYQMTGGADKDQKQFEESQTRMLNNYKDAVANAKSATDPVKKQRFQKLAEKIQEDMGTSYKDRVKRLNDTMEATDPTKAAAAVGEIGLNILTAGAGGAAAQGSKAIGKEAVVQAGKEAASQGGRLAAKNIAKNAGIGAVQGAGSGALGAVEQKGKDTKLSDVATGALMGGIMGGGMTAGLGALGVAARKLPKDQGGFIKNPLYHTTTADNVDSILNDGKLVNQSVDKPGVSFDSKDSTTWANPTKENVQIAYNKNTVDAYGYKGEKGGQATASESVPVTPDTVAAVKVGTEETAQKFRDKGFQNVTVDDALDMRPKAEKNVVMPAEVEPPTTASLSMKVPRKIYRAGTPYDPAKVTSEGISVTPNKGIAQKKFGGSTYPAKPGARTQELELSPDTKIMPFSEIPSEMYKYAKRNGKETGEINPAGEGNGNYEKIIELAKSKGYDAVDLKRFGEGEIRVWNAEKIIDPSLQKELPMQLKVLDDIQREADFRAPGDANTPHAQQTETKVQKGAQYIVDDIDALQKQTGIDVDPLDRKVAGALTGEVRRSGYQEFKDKMGRNFQDTLTYAARTMGKTGTDFVYDMLQGNKFKRDALTALRDNMSEISKLNKKLAGKSLTARRDLGARIGAALDDRANVGQLITKPEERKLFDRYVQVFDYIKGLREKSGLETLENYRPWVNMKEAAEPPTWLAENVTNKRTQTLSRFSKERTRTEVDDKVDNNLADMIYGYVNSQLNEMAYDAPVRKFKGNIDNLNAGNKANVAGMNDGLDYMRTLVEQAVNPARKNPAERFAGKLTSNVYGAVLPFNVRLAIQNKTQKFVANSRVSKGARSMAKKLSESDAKELEKGLIFGDTTVYGQLEDVNPVPSGKGKGVIEKVKKVDPYQKSEHNNVITSYHKGAMQAVKESEVYKAAKANGQKTEEAIHTALQDPQVRESAIRRGNVVVNDTQFGASPLARPEMLREEGSLWGIIPKKIIYMFTRFPIGMSQHTLEVLDNKGTRALEMLKNGDPRAVPIAEMRTNFHVLLDSMKDAQKALDKGTDIGIPKDVLNEQIAVVGKNLKTIDSQAKKLSQIRGGKTVKNLGKMWAAAAAIQIIFDGGIQSFADDPVGTSTEAINKTNPTMGNRVVGEYSPLAAITSSASPINKYGKINTRAVTNYIPVVGLAVNRGRDIQKLVESLTGSSN